MRPKSKDKMVLPTKVEVIFLFNIKNPLKLTSEFRAEEDFISFGNQLIRTAIQEAGWREDPTQTTLSVVTVNILRYKEIPSAELSEMVKEARKLYE